MCRIAVVGSPGAGKSTLSRRLGALLGVPVLHLDRLYWHPGWVPTPRDEWIRIQEEALRGDRWIVDGNYGGTMGVRLAAAETIVFLDYPAALCLWRACLRAARSRGTARPDMAAGCPERVNLEFLRFIWRFRRDQRPRILQRLGDLPPGKPVIHLRSRRAAAALLGAVARSGSLPP